MGSLKVIGLEKSYGIRTLFSNVNFEVMHGDKIGLVGANGAERQHSCESCSDGRSLMADE